MRVLVGLAVGLLLAGCAGSDAADRGAESLADVPTTTTPPTPEPTVNIGGEDGGGDLTEFRCGPDPTGVWNASGLITNPTPQAVDYQVTVLVAGSDAARPQAKQRVLAQVRTNDPVSFEVPRIPVSGSGEPTCQVRVVRMR